MHSNMGISTPLFLLCLVCARLGRASPAADTKPPLLTAISQDADLSTFYGLFNGTGGSSGKPAPDLEERFNNGRDGLYRIVFAPTNKALAELHPSTLARLRSPTSYQLLVALLRTHMTDPVAGPVDVKALAGRTFTAVEGWQLAVSANGSLVTNSGISDTDVPLSRPQANLVRGSGPGGAFVPGTQAANGAVFKIDGLLNPFITYFGQDSSLSSSLPPVDKPKVKTATATMADVLSTDEDLSALHDILSAVAPDFLQRLALFPSAGRAGHDDANSTTTTTVYLAPGNNATRSSVGSATRPYNAAFSRDLLLAGFGELRGNEVRGVGGAVVPVHRDLVGNSRVVKRVRAVNGEVWILKRWLDPMLL